MSEWKRRIWIWTTVALLAALAAYPLAAGPWTYWKFRSQGTRAIYDGWGPFSPLIDNIDSAPTSIREPYVNYLNWCALKGLESGGHGPSPIL